MFKKFKEGLVFGSGFAISFIVIWYLAAYFLFPLYVNSKIEKTIGTQPPSTQSGLSQYKTEKPFHTLTVDDRIKQSSVIAIAKYESSPDGKMKAIIKEFLKKEPGITIYYDIGDEYSSSSYYPEKNTRYGDGIVIFFTGNPATMRMSMTYSGDRIRGLGDLPIELLRKKCAKKDE